MRLFFAPEIESTLMLTEEDSKHAIKVLRLKEDDLIEDLDKGFRAAAKAL